MESNHSPKQTSFFKELLIFGIAIAPIFYLLSIWESLPQQIPIHWNIKGEVDGYSDKSSLWWVILAMNAPIYLLLLFLPKLSAKQKNIQLMGKKYYRLRLILQLFLSALVFAILLASSGNSSASIETLLGYCFVFFMLSFGNYMGSIRQNHFMGIRTPWTLENEEVWKKTHQLGGRLWIGSAIIGLVLLLILPSNWILIIIVALMTIPMFAAAIYSFILFKKIT
ncbi:SdpI family protein [Aureispira anguillae]|uniref:SdpI family protein n=1 Tax=Aureispira anguillae TaxID=2864201 RepID=A0A915YIK6_9BACT|nr:SdpI family protein [Aureispira anguillae]BDS13748.1 SdpI family protein [Aureispira anguillae]